MRRLLPLLLCIVLLAGCVITPIEPMKPKPTPVPIPTCEPTAAPPPTAVPTETPQPTAVTLVEQGWSDDLAAQCTPSGDCATPVPGYYYRLYESTEHACETTGNHEFLVIDPSDDPMVPRNLFVKFLGGGVGFWYDVNGTPAHWPNDAESAVETAAYNRRMLFRAGLSAEHAHVEAAP